MGLSHGVYDVLVLKDEMDCRPVWKALLVRSIYFATAIIANQILCILLLKIKGGEGLFSEESIESVISFFKDPNFQMQLAEFFVIAYLLTFVRSVHKKFGKRVFWNTLLGKSQEPREEELVFMFIDLKRSTTICEELGNMQYSNFIKEYYALLSNCCEENRGEIYQFAGDGVFITWKKKRCRNKAHPVSLFFDFKECLSNTRYRFSKRYGVWPDFKASVHCGKVIATEVGNFGSEMAYHGDVLNTTSRIQSLCAKLGHDFLASEDIIKALPSELPQDFVSTKAGSFELRGKKNPIMIFSLDSQKISGLFEKKN
ncbi:MAG: adenylate/guanylate cyclase domain-containing protein [Fibrobacter sp.]|nr:adenylate/guanylate cyclase domain-containing protein [Fibrobacter sp.]